jgi:hypothetical protein
MSVSSRLQCLISRIATTGTLAKDELLDELAQIRDHATQADLRATRDRMCFAELVDGLEQKTLDQQGLIERARRRHSRTAPQLQAVG